MTSRGRKSKTFSLIQLLASLLEFVEASSSSSFVLARFMMVFDEVVVGRNSLVVLQKQDKTVCFCLQGRAWNFQGT